MGSNKKTNSVSSYWFWVVAIIAVAIFFFYVDFSSLGVNQAKLVIKFDGNNSREFSGQVYDGMTVIQAIEAASRGDDFKMSYFIDRSNGVKLAFIGASINGFNNKNWHFYLNKKQIPTDQVDEVKVGRGDLIEAVFE